MAETLKNKLRRLGDEMTIWVETANWRECNRADWMTWLCLKMLDKPGWPSKVQLTAALACVFDDALRYAFKNVIGEVINADLEATSIAECDSLIRNAVFVSLENPKSIEFWREVLAMETVWFESSREVYDMAHYATCGSDHSEAERLLARWADILRERLSVPKELVL